MFFFDDDWKGDSIRPNSHLYLSPSTSHWTDNLILGVKLKTVPFNMCLFMCRLTWIAGSATVVLTLQGIFIANRAHAVITRVPIKPTTIRTQHLGLIGFLSHIPLLWREQREYYYKKDIIHNFHQSCHWSNIYFKIIIQNSLFIIL